MITILLWVLAAFVVAVLLSMFVDWMIFGAAFDGLFLAKGNQK